LIFAGRAARLILLHGLGALPGGLCLSEPESFSLRESLRS
jgi:hypothetical protein